MNMKTKVCKSCGKEKKVESFTKNKNMRSGYLNTCKICFNQRAKQYREKKEKVKLELDPNLRLANTKLLDWCRMWKIVEQLGYDIHGDIHQQFCERHTLPYKKKPPKNIKTYIPSDCEEYWKNIL